MPFVQEFKKFALRGNMLDLVVGFTVGAAFTTVVRSLVDDILMLPVGLLLGSADFADLFIVLAPSEAVPPPYPTLQAAQEAGAVTLNDGRFINTGIALLLVALAMFAVVRVINRLDATFDTALGDETPAEQPTHKKCPYCVSTIPFLAKRCPECTSELPPEAAAEFVNPGTSPPG